MTNNKKQTAVQMAFEKLAQQGLLVVDDYENLNAYHEAKAMEKEQIIQAILSLDQTDNIWDKEIFSNMAKQYYNQTYKQP